MLLGQVPALAIIAVWAGVHRAHEQELGAEFLSSRAQALSLALGENARGVERQLHALAAEVPASRTDLPSFLQRAERVRRLAGIHSLAFTGDGGEQVAMLPLSWEASTSTETLPRGLGPGGSATRAQAGDRPLLDPGSIRVQVPGSAGLGWIIANLDPAAARLLLEEAGWPATWSAAVVDTRGMVVAGIGPHAGDVLAGIPAPAGVRGHGQGVFEAPAPEGGVMVTAYMPSRVPGWLAVVRAPRSEIYGSLRPAGGATLLFWLLLPLLALLLSIRVFAGVLDTVRRVREQATSPGLAEDLPQFPDAFAEGQLVRDRMQADAAELRRTHARVARAEERLETILQASTDAIIVTDARDQILLANEAAARAFGISAQQLAGTHVGRLLAQDTFDDYLACREAGEAACAPGAPRAPRAGWCRRVDGSMFPVEYSLSVFPGIMGRRFCTLVARDITAQRENADLHRRHDELQSALLKEAELRQAALARELHDGIASSLAGVSLLLGTASAGLADHKVAALISKSQEQVVRAMEQIRQISRGIMPAGQDYGALLPALEQFAADVDRLPGIRCRFSSRGDFGALSGEVGGHLFRIVQEATNNALRHGGAHRIHIMLARVGARSRLTLQDDGVGCDPRTLAAPATGIGLGSMRARAQAIGGVFEARTRLGKGFRVVVSWVNH